MMPRRGAVMGLIAGAGVFAALAYLAVWGELVVRRELYRVFEFVGIMDPDGALGGQIMGFNFQREPAWAHWVIQSLAACLAHAPGILGAVVVMRRVSGASRDTLCGGCGGVLWGLREPRCGGCGAGFEEVGRGDREGRVRWYVVGRVAVAVVCFSAAYTYVSREHAWTVQEWVLERGEAAGCTVFKIGKVVFGPDGPFHGDDAGTAAWNWTWRYSGFAAAAGAGFVAAMLGYGVCAGPLGGTRAFGYRGRTRCGGCGYALEGLKEMRCPECGRGI